MAKRTDRGHRLDRRSTPTLRNWKKPAGPAADQLAENVALEMGWGRLVFGQTWASNEDLAQQLLDEQPGRRDIALYLRDPHVVISLAPQQLFLDPSHTYRLWSHAYRPSSRVTRAFEIRRLRTMEDAEAVLRIYKSRGMVPCDPTFLLEEFATRLRTYFVAATPDGSVVGTVTGVDHVRAFDDPENGSSLWCLAVDPQAEAPGLGENLVRHLVEHYFARGREYVDLSVMHDNEQAIALYEKLGFERVPVFCVKRMNPINEPLFAPADFEDLNPYARIILDEARRRGIRAELVDRRSALFRLTFGGRSILCRESLSELTSSVAMTICDDKSLTHRVLRRAGLQVPDQTEVGPDPANESEVGAFLRRHERVVVKPARGEQGAGIAVDLADRDEILEAIENARAVCPRVLLEEMVEGDDLRIVVIDHRVVAAAVRRPPRVIGTGQHTIEQLIAKYNRRRAAATGNESRVPLDEETRRCLSGQGWALGDVPPAETRITVRRAANLHTGGTIHDVTDELCPELAQAAEDATRAVGIPVAGLDFLVEDVSGGEHVIVEVNERPGLANHEPRPTAERFVDLLFPGSAERTGPGTEASPSEGADP